MLRNDKSPWSFIDCQRSLDESFSSPLASENLPASERYEDKCIDSRGSEGKDDRNVRVEIVTSVTYHS